MTIDEEQNWFPLHMETKSGYTIFKFTRKLTLCNPNPNDLDLNITSGENWIIYAWGENLQYNDILYHGSNRGSLKVDLLKNPNFTSTQVILLFFNILII